MPPPFTRAAMALVVAVLAVACTPPATDPPRPTSADSGREHWPVSVAQLPAAGPAAAATRSEAETPAVSHAAATVVVELLEAEGLSVFDLTISIETSAPDRADVIVWVLHGTGQSYPHSSSYHVQLVRDDGRWVVAAVETAP